MTKQKKFLSPHEKQMRFMTYFFGAVMVITASGILWLVNIMGSTGRIH